MYINSLTVTTTLRTGWSSFYGWVTCGPQRWSNLAKITWIVKCRARFTPQRPGSKAAFLNYSVIYTKEYTRIRGCRDKKNRYRSRDDVLAEPHWKRTEGLLSSDGKYSFWSCLHCCDINICPSKSAIYIKVWCKWDSLVVEFGIRERKWIYTWLF